MKTLLLAVVFSASTALASSTDGAAWGANDTGDVGLAVLPWSSKALLTQGGGLQDLNAFLIAARVNVGTFTHQTVFGTPGGIQFMADLGYFSDVTTKSGQSVNMGWRFYYDFFICTNFVVLATTVFKHQLRLQVLAGFGMWFNGVYLAGGGRLAFELIRDVISIDGQYTIRPGATYDGSFEKNLQHRISGAIVIEPIHLALGVDVMMGSFKEVNGLPTKGTPYMGDYFSIGGTAAWRFGGKD